MRAVQAVFHWDRFVGMRRISSRQPDRLTRHGRYIALWPGNPPRIGEGEHNDMRGPHILAAIDCGEE